MILPTSLFKRLGLLLTTVLVSVNLLLADALSDFTGSPAINAPQASVYIINLENGRELVAHNIDKPLIPASIMKSVTIATLLEKVGPDFRFATPVYMDGAVADGVLEGNIIVEASGDPSINTRHAPGSNDLPVEIADALKALGIKRVSGRVLIDESGFPGAAINPSWASGDLPHSYGTGTHGFNFEDNASGKKSVKDPAGVFRSRLRAALSKAGIALGDSNISSSRHKTLLGEHRSEPVDEIMRSCMMRSDNQYAEAFLRAVGKTYGKEGSTAEGAAKLLEHWRKRHADMAGVNVVDGSGLSRSNRVTTRFMADVLRMMASNPYYASFFPLAGQEGTLRSFLKDTPLDGWIAMKTGSMNGIQCYAGYKLDEDYAPTHIVVVMLNEMANRGAARRQVEKLLLRTFVNDQQYDTYGDDSESAEHN